MDETPSGKQLTTSKLLNQLFKTTSFERFAKTNEQSMRDVSLSKYLEQLCAERGVVREHVIKRAGFERTYGHQIFRGARRASRDKVIQLAFGFELDVEEAQALLRVAGMATLYPRIRRDAAILYCIHNKLDLIVAQALLSEQGITGLGMETL